MQTYLYVTPFFPSPDDWRGTYGYDFIAALIRVFPYIRVEVFVPGSGDSYEIGGVRVWRFAERKLPSDIFPFLFRRYNVNRFLEAVRRAGIDFADVIVCHGNTATYSIYPLALKRFNPKVKTLLHHHDLQSFGLNGGILRQCWLYNLYMFPVLRRFHERIDCHVFISEASRRSFLEAPDTSWTDYRPYKSQMRMLPYKSVHIKDSILLHNGVNTKLFYKIRCDNIRPKDKFVIGCVGNFEVLKDQLTLIKATEIVKEKVDLKIEIRFVGSGPTLALCKQYVATQGLENMVSFLPEMKHEKLPNFYRGLDMFVLPSVFEGFGCVYAEAWSCGVPFIACEGQGIADLIPEKDKENWLMRAHDVEGLANKIINYLLHRPVQELTENIDIDLTLKRVFRGILP